MSDLVKAPSLHLINIRIFLRLLFILQGTWHVIVGSSFGCSITHKTKKVLHFKIFKNELDVLHVLIFRSEDC